MITRAKFLLIEGQLQNLDGTLSLKAAAVKPLDLLICEDDFETPMTSIDFGVPESGRPSQMAKVWRSWSARPFLYQLRTKKLA